MSMSLPRPAGWRLRRLLPAVLALSMCATAGAARADSLTLTPGNPTSDGIPTTVNSSGSVSPSSSGRVSAFREVDHGTGCPSTFNSAASQGAPLGSHTFPSGTSGPFSYDDPNSGTQAAGTTYILCGYLETSSGTTIASGGSYTTPSAGPPPGTSAPTAVTGSAGSGGSGGAVLSGTVKTNGFDTTYRFDYGTTTAYGQSVAGDGAVGGTVTSARDVYVTTPPLPPGTTIHYQLVAVNAAGSSDGGDRVGTTPGGTPTVTTGAASDLTHDGFTLHGSYNPHGNAGAHFEYTLAPADGGEHVSGTAPLPAVAEKDQGSENVASQVVPTGFDEYWRSRWPAIKWLTPYSSPTFHGESAAVTIAYRLVVGDTNGSWRTVTSPVPTASPTVSTGGAKTAIGEFGIPYVVLSGTVNDHAQGYSFTAFQVGPTTSYGMFCPVLDQRVAEGVGLVPSSSQAISQSTAYCNPRYPAGTTIHYRFVAGNGGPGGVAHGSDRTYTVPGTVPPPSTQTIVAALTQSLGVSGAAGKIAAILKASGYPAVVTAPGAGTESIAWYQVPRGAHVGRAAKPILIASGKKTVTGKGKVKIRLRLTSKGKALLKTVKRRHKLKLTALGSFKAKGGKKAISKTKGISLKN